MRSWLWLAMLSIAVAALGAWVYYKPTPAQSQTYALSAMKPNEVKHLKLSRPSAGPRPAAEPIALEKREGEWRMTAPIAARAENFQIERLLSIVEARSSVRYPTTDLVRFGLDRPFAVLTLEDQAYTFGAINTTTREQYVMTGNQVYLVPLAYIATLPRNADALLAKRMWAAGETPVRFDLPGFTVALEGGTWAVAPPMADVGADERSAWVEGWRHASAISAARRGAAKPIGEIKVQLKDARTIALAIVQREPELVLAREDEGVEYRFVAEVAKRMLLPPGGAGAKR